MTYYQTILSSDRATLGLAGDTAAPIVCGTKKNSPNVHDIAGEIRHYAGNRVRAAVYDQENVSTSITLVHLSLKESQKVLAWRGQVVLLRTIEGARIFGVYFNASTQRVLRTTPETIDSATDVVTYDIDLDITRVTYAEAGVT